VTRLGDACPALAASAARHRFTPGQSRFQHRNARTAHAPSPHPLRFAPAAGSVRVRAADPPPPNRPGSTTAAPPPAPLGGAGPDPARPPPLRQARRFGRSASEHARAPPLHGPRAHFGPAPVQPRHTEPAPADADSSAANAPRHHRLRSLWAWAPVASAPVVDRSLPERTLARPFPWPLARTVRTLRRSGCGLSARSRFLWLSPDRSALLWRSGCGLRARSRVALPLASRQNLCALLRRSRLRPERALARHSPLPLALCQTRCAPLSQRFSAYPLLSCEGQQRHRAVTGHARGGPCARGAAPDRPLSCLQVSSSPVVVRSCASLEHCRRRGDPDRSIPRPITSPPPPWGGAG
jgi:hypothetical protein